ncbi:MAG TPA: AMP-dependent synthetase, partial [Vicinamibacteria bacterium]
ARQAVAARGRGQAALATEAQSLADVFDAMSRTRHRELLDADPVDSVGKALAQLAGAARAPRSIA